MLHAPNKYRVRHGELATGDDMGNNGAFLLPNLPPSSLRLTVVCSDGRYWVEDGLEGTPWEHVSVSTQTRCPTWAEM